MSDPWKSLDAGALSDDQFSALSAHLRSGRVDPHSTNIIAKAIDAQSLADRVEAQQAKIAELEAKLLAAAATIEKPVA